MKAVCLVRSSLHFASTASVQRVAERYRARIMTGSAQLTPSPAPVFSMRVGWLMEPRSSGTTLSGDRYRFDPAPVLHNAS